MRRKIGPRYTYPNLPLPEKLKAIIVNARPFTLGLPIFGGWAIIQASLGRLTVPTPDPLLTTLAIAVMVLINAVGNYVNSITDLSIDRINKPYRPLPSGRLTVKEAKYLVYVGEILIAALVPASFIIISKYNSINNGILFFALANASLCLTVFYSLEPFRLKRFLWVNNITQATIRGVLGPLAMWVVYSTINEKILGICTVMFTFIVFAQSIKDFDDVPGDALNKIRTLPVVYGPKKTIGLIAFGTALAIFLLGALTLVRILSPIVALFFVAPAGVFIFYLGKPYQSLVENRWSWVLFYATMVFLLIGFMVSAMLESASL